MTEIWMEIPREYTAACEWMSCMIFILLIERRRPWWQTAIASAATFWILREFLVATRNVPIVFWIPCMVAAVIAMCAFIGLCCNVRPAGAIYYGTIAFIMAEFIASFEWQITSFVSIARVPSFIEAKVLAGVCFNAVAIPLFLILRPNISRDGEIHISNRELIAHVLIVIGVFTISNFSYLSIDTPFTSSDDFQIGNIRTFVDAAGLAILYAQLIRANELYARRELETVRTILRNQYTQYQQSQDAIDLINYKYHDLKHQIAYLQSEDDPNKRAAYLSRMEEEIRQYDAQNKTGNKVLDTILTAKSLYCAKNGISMTCVADGTLLEFMGIEDICSIFGNALDNAIECESKIDDPEHRLIHVTVARQKTFLLLRFENYYEEAPQQSGNRFLTSKDNKEFHGYGIKSIEYTVAKYAGAVDIQAQEHWFTLRVLIPIPE